MQYQKYNWSLYDQDQDRLLWSFFLLRFLRKGRRRLQNFWNICRIAFYYMMALDLQVIIINLIYSKFDLLSILNLNHFSSGFKFYKCSKSASSATLQGSICHIYSAYYLMVRSLLNLPVLNPFKIDFFVHSSVFTHCKSI